VVLGPKRISQAIVRMVVMKVILTGIRGVFRCLCDRRDVDLTFCSQIGMDTIV
jgi:hypothetical protein